MDALSTKATNEKHWLR